MDWTFCHTPLFLLQNLPVSFIYLFYVVWLQETDADVVKFKLKLESAFQ